MSQGYIKLWRSTQLWDFDMPDFQFKLWIKIQLLAIHAGCKGLGPGELLISNGMLQEQLRRQDGTIPSVNSIRAALNGLITLGYITVQRRSGLMTKVKIVRWEEMQGKHPEGHDFQRYDLPPASESDAIPYQ